MALTKVTGGVVSPTSDYAINNVTGVAATFTGNVSIGGTLTYQDVTNIDAVGIITAQAGIHLGIGATSGKFLASTGITTFTKIGVGLVSPTATFHVNGTTNGLQARFGGTGTGLGIECGQKTNTNALVKLIAQDATHGTLTFETAGNEALRIDSSRRLLVGHTASRDVFRETRVQISGNTGDTAGLSIYSIENGNGGPNLILGHSRNGNKVTDGTILGDITFVGHDDNDLNSRAAIIRSIMTADGADNSLYADLLFFTKRNAGGYPEESLRITSAGDVGIGTAVPINSGGYANLSLVDTTGGQLELKKLSNDTRHYIWGNDNLHIGAGYVNGGSSSLKIYVNGAVERLRIFSNGRIGIGTDTAPRDMVHLHNPTANASSYIQFTNANTGGTGINDGTLIGISQNNSNTDGTGSGFTILQKENAEITLGTNNTERLRITSGGKVGINTSVPQSDLQIITAGQDQDGTLRIGGSVPELGLVIDYDQSGSTVSRIYANANYNSDTSLLKICSDLDDNPNQLVLAGSGNVGIGTAIPGAEFEVRGTSTVAHFKGTGGNCFIGLTDVDAGAGIGYIGSDGGDLLFQTPGSSYSTKLQITSAGKVGIGITNPSEDLEVKGDQTATIFINSGQHDASTAQEATLKLGFNQSHANDSIGHVKLIEAGGNNFGGDLAFAVPYNNSGTPTTREALRIKWNGNVGINESSPTAQLVVKATTDDNPALQLYRQSTGGDIASLVWETGAGTQAKINYRGAAGASEGLQFYTAGGSSSQLRMIIDHSGNVGIGTNDPRAKFDVRPGGHSGDGAITFTTGLGEVGSSNNAIQSINGVGSALQPLGYRATEHIFATQTTDRFRIDSSGRILIGHSASLSEGCLLQVARANDNTVELFGFSANANGARINFTKSRGAVGGNTIVHDDDTIGELHFRAASGSGYYRVAAIEAEIDGTPSTSSLPGRLIFSTTPSGALTQTERLRITSAGKMGLGTGNNDPVGGDFVIENTTGTAGVALSRVFSGNVATSAVNTPSFAFTMSDTATNDQVVASISPQALAGTGDAFKGHIRVFTANDAGTNTERLRITSDGDLLVGTTTGAYRLNVQEDLNSGGNLAYFANSDSTYNQGLTLSFDSNKDIEWSGGSGAGGMDWNMGTRGYVWRVQGADKLRLGSGGLLSIDATSYEALKITTTSAGNNGPEVQLIHNSSSPAANDCIGQLRFSGKDSAGNTDLMGRIETIIDDPTSGAESAHLNFGIRGQSSFNTTFRIKRRGTASAPSYTADDIDGIIYDTYNSGSGSGYKRYMSLIAKSAGDTDSNLSFWTEAVGGSPTEKVRIDQQGHLHYKGIEHSISGTNTTSASITPANNDWVTFASLPYGHGIQGELFVNWTSVQAPSCCYHGDANLRIGGNHFTYHYGWESTLELISCQAHNSAWFRAWRLIRDGSSLKLQGRWAGATVQAGTFFTNITKGNINPKATGYLSAITPVVENSLSGTVQAQCAGAVDNDSPPDSGSSSRWVQHSKYGIIHSHKGLDTAGVITAWQQPRSSAYKNAGQVYTTTATIVTYGNQTDDANSRDIGGDNYDPSTGKFTCPQSGVYFVSYSANINASSNWAYLECRVNGSAAFTHTRIMHYDFPRLTFSGSNYCNCETGDEIAIYAWTNTGTVSGDNFGLFQVYMLS